MNTRDSGAMFAVTLRTQQLCRHPAVLCSRLYHTILGLSFFIFKKSTITHRFAILKTCVMIIVVWNKSWMDNVHSETVSFTGEKLAVKMYFKRSTSDCWIFCKLFDWSHHSRDWQFLMVNLNLSAIFKIQFTTQLKHIILHRFVFSVNRTDFTMKIGFLKFVSS